MKGMKALVAVMVASSLLAAAVPASAGATAYKHYVGCGVARKAPSSRMSVPGSRRRAPSSKASRRPTSLHGLRPLPERQNLCAHTAAEDEEEPQAGKGQLYVNKITSTIPGKHRVTWFVKGKKVGTFVFRVKR